MPSSSTVWWCSIRLPRRLEGKLSVFSIRRGLKNAFTSRQNLLHKFWPCFVSMITTCTSAQNDFCFALPWVVSFVPSVRLYNARASRGLAGLSATTSTRSFCCLSGCGPIAKTTLQVDSISLVFPAWYNHINLALHNEAVQNRIIKL